MTYKEFRSCCRAYGYTSDIRALFGAFDTDGQGLLTKDEVIFLDEWETPLPAQEAPEEVLLPHSMETASNDGPGYDLTSYETIGPGPAGYHVPSTVGAGPLTPMLKFSGAFSFTRRPAPRRLPKLGETTNILPSPDKYDVAPGMAKTMRAKPSWGFGSSSRPCLAAVKPTKNPWPGHYSPGVVRQGPQFSCTPRRPNKMHPLHHPAKSEQAVRKP